MRVAELLRYTQAFYRRWDTTYAEQLLRQFSLDVGARIKTLSRGQRARLGLIAAEAHHPDLLILDEPSSGLDPIVRRDILEAISVPLDIIFRFQGFMILVALLVMPLGRVGLAPSCLARNRHRC